MRATRARRMRTDDRPHPGRKHGGNAAGMSGSFSKHNSIFWATASVGRMARPHGGMKRR